MKSNILFLGFVLCAAQGCGDDDSATAVDGSMTDAMVSDASGSNDAGQDGAVVPDAEIPATATISGIAAMSRTQTPVEGATVFVLQNPDVTTATDAEGKYSLDIPTGVQFIVFAKQDLFGGVLAVELAADESATLDSELVPEAMLDEIEVALDEPINRGRGIVIVDLNDEAPVGTTVSISAVNDGAFTFGPEGPVKGNVTLEGGETFVGFHSVSSETDYTTVTVSEGCTPNIDVTDWPVYSEALTRVEYTCN